MGMDYQLANVGEQQGDLEWVGCREDGKGIRSFELQLNGTLKGLTLSA